MESVIRTVYALQSLQPSEVSDPTLPAVTQLTVELDEVLFPINTVSTKKYHPRRMPNSRVKRA